jgi:ADP-heptose:LPS heptosyltransferase
MGDTVLTLPYLHALRRALPDAQLDFLTREEVATIPREAVLFDSVFEIGGARNPRHQLISALGLLPRLRGQRYDVVLDLQRSRISRLVRHLLRPSAWSEFDRFSPRLAGERTRATIEAAGLGPLDVRADVVPRDPGAGLPALRAAGWDGASRLVVLNPAGAFRGRHWPHPAWARFAELWLAGSGQSMQFLVLGLPALADSARYLQERLGGRLVNLAGHTTPAEAFALLRRSALVVSEDSGLMHMAWAGGVPTLGVFGASRAGWARPHGSHADSLRACELPDGACMDGHCRASGATCLERISPVTVVEAARALLSSAPESARIPATPQ